MVMTDGANNSHRLPDQVWRQIRICRLAGWACPYRWLDDTSRSRRLLTGASRDIATHCTYGKNSISAVAGAGQNLSISAGGARALGRGPHPWPSRNPPLIRPFPNSIFPSQEEDFFALGPVRSPYALPSSLSACGAQYFPLETASRAVGVDRKLPTRRLNKQKSLPQKY
jgi:hypothetical protein